MYHNFKFTDINEALPHLLESVRIAPEVGSRAGRTRELTHVGITLTEPLSREILVPGRKANLAAQIAETAWVLAGRNDIEFLSHYLPRAADFSDDGKTWRAGYGPRLRKWVDRVQCPECGGKGFTVNLLDEQEVCTDCSDGWVNKSTDQLAYIVEALRADPETRQAVAVLWDPPVDEQPGKDRACNNWLHFLARAGELDLHVAIRSNDLMWGWSGINAFEWSVLLEIVAGLTGLSVGALHFSTTSLHLYGQHWEKAKRIVDESAATERVNAEPSPRFKTDRVLDMEWFDWLLDRWFHVEYDIRTGSPLVQPYIDSFPEPMLRSWLRVLDWWWNGPRFASLPGDALAVAAGMGVKPPWQARTIEEKDIKQRHDSIDQLQGSLLTSIPAPSPFLTYAINLHNEKHAAYGDSWKRRGEMLGIMANIARKIDRLGGSATADETSADTALDLMVYLAKYRTWLCDQGLGAGLAEKTVRASDDTMLANALLIKAEKEIGQYRIGLDDAPSVSKSVESSLRESFDRLESRVMTDDPTRFELVDRMLLDAYQLARFLWETEQREKSRQADQENANREIDRAVYEEFHPGSTGNPTEYPGADHE